jgi:hypothetical protein
MKQELLSVQMSKLSVEVSTESKQAIVDDPFLSEWNNRLHKINSIYDRFCEEYEIPRQGIGDPSPFPQTMIDICLQNGLLWYDEGRLTARPR